MIILHPITVGIPSVFRFWKSSSEKLREKRQEYLLHEEVVQELKQGKKNEGVYAKAFADAKGNLDATKAIYIDLIVDEKKLQKKVVEEKKSKEDQADRKEKNKLKKEEKRKRERPGKITMLVFIFLNVFLIFIAKQLEY